MKSFAQLESWPCPNVSAAAISGGSIAVHGDQDRSFALASITKLFTAAAVLLGVEEGSIALDQPIDDRGATVADALAHASGLAPNGLVLDEPGLRRIYSNAAYEIVADTLAKETEMTFSDYLTEGILQPLGMASTTLEGSPAFGASSTVSDLVRFVEGLPTLLDSSTYDQMTSPYLPELIGVLPGYGRQTPNTWGLGPEIRSSKTPHWTGESNSERTWGHFGQAGTFLWVDPEIDGSLIVLTDRDFGDWAMTRWPTLSNAVRAELGD